MDSYTITIAPNDDSGAATRLVVDTSGDQVRITDVHLHAPQGLSSGHIPTVDFDLLLRAVTGSVTPSPGRDAAGAAELSAPPGTPAIEAGSADRPATKSGTRKAPSRPAPTRSARAASEEKAAAPRRSARAGATATTRTGKPAPAKTTRAATTKATPAPAKKRAATRAAAPTPVKRPRTATAPTGRVYRRTPDDLAAIFERVGTVAGVAAHYQVPRHTAQGWVNRLRATA